MHAFIRINDFFFNKRVINRSCEAVIIFPDKFDIKSNIYYYSPNSGKENAKHIF